MEITKFNYVPDNLTIFPGFYESELYHCDSEINWNDDEKYEYKKFMPCEIDNFEEFTTEVCMGISSEIADLLVDNEICLSCEHVGMSSPREYNFTTDKILLDLEIDLPRLAMMVWYDEELHKGFDAYLNEKYSSRSGFISFVENEIGDFFDKWEYLSVLVDYWLLTKIFDDTDVVGCQSRYDCSYYSDRMFEISDLALSNHMVPICKEDWLYENAYNEKAQEFAKIKFNADKEMYARTIAQRVLDEDLADEFCEFVGCMKYEEAENIETENVEQ